MQVTSYDVFIDLDFSNSTFKGRVFITIKADKDVVLNSVGLKIETVSSGGQSYHFSQSGEDLTVKTGAFDGILEVDYAGTVQNSLVGIYRAPYDNTHIVTTHFEAAQARRMFPCIDRPDMKAAFRLSVRIDKSLDAISNMPVESVQPDGDKKKVTFQKTPRMSTYLLYLGVGNFQQLTARMGKTELIVASTPGKVDLGRFAQDEAQKAVRYFESYFAIPYALPKLHLIAVPEFAMGAMENWGAITFRESRLLVDANTSTKSKMLVSLSVAHELAHQWFGDLVTMKWWDNIWLNESFASFMANKAVDSFHPEWRVWENTFNGQPKAEALAEAMGRDSLVHTHPVQVPVNSPDEIEQIFDAISYAKGCHILRMIEAYVGEEAFRDGVRRFLSTNAYSNATGEDFWSALEGASKKPVQKIMTQWIHQSGYPVVTASLQNGELKLHQERFLVSGKTDTTVWPIPIVLEVNGEARSIVMEKVDEAIGISHLQSLNINPRHGGFYSVRYVGLDEYVWRARLTPFDEWGLLYDAFSFFLSGRITTSDYLAVINRFMKETDTLPAQEASDQIALLYAVAPSKFSEVSKKLHTSLLEIFHNKTDENSSILHGTVAGRLALVDEGYASKLGVDFKRYTTIAPDMRAAVALSYARSTNDLNGLLEAYRASRSDEDRINFLGAVTGFKDKDLLRRALDFSLSTEVKRQDAYWPILAALRNPEAKNVAWSWLRDNIQKLEAVYHGTGLLSDMILRIVPILGIGKVDEVESFFEEHKMLGAEAGLNAALDKLRTYDRLVGTLAKN